MSDRRQYVFFNGCKSTLRIISTVLVQGSILGPLLFIIYSNDSVKISSVLKFSLQAEDTCLSLASNHLPYLMEVFKSEVAHLGNWFKANYLTLNPSMGNYVIFHRDRKLVVSLRTSRTIDGQTKRK